MRTLVTRGDTQNIKLFDRLVMELCPYLLPLEIDKVVGFMDRIQGSKWDINPSEEDSVTQLKLILGSDRYAEVKMLWTVDNQHLTREHGTKKYMRKSDSTMWDGLDDSDNPSDYVELFV